MFTIDTYGGRAVRRMATRVMTEADPDNALRAARVRAARAYADIDQPTVAKALGVSTISVKRMERGSRTISLEDLHTLADLCGVPLAFMTDGFPSPTDGDTNGLIESVRKQQRELADEIHARFDALNETLSIPVGRAIAQDAARRLAGD